MVLNSHEKMSCAEKHQDSEVGSWGQYIRLRKLSQAEKTIQCHLLTLCGHESTGWENYLFRASSCNFNTFNAQLTQFMSFWITWLSVFQAIPRARWGSSSHCFPELDLGQHNVFTSRSSVTLNSLCSLVQLKNVVVACKGSRRIYQIFLR